MVLILLVAVLLLLDATLTLVSSDVEDLSSTMLLSSSEDPSAASVMRACRFAGTVLLGLLPLFGQLLAMCPRLLQRKHLPSFWS